MVPKNPIKTPKICGRLKVILKIIKPSNIVLSGVSEFNIEAIELSISVMAKANKKAGKKVPKIPEILIHFQVFLSKFFSFREPIRKIKIPEINILSATNCIGVNPNRAFFIKIKELPQIMESVIKKIHFLFDASIV